MGRVRREGQQATKIVAAIEEAAVLGLKHLNDALQNARALQELGWQVRPEAKAEIEGQIAQCVRALFLLPVQLPAEPANEKTRSFMRSDMRACAAVLTLQTIFEAVNRAIPELVRRAPVREQADEFPKRRARRSSTICDADCSPNVGAGAPTAETVSTLASRDLARMVKPSEATRSGPEQVEQTSGDDVSAVRAAEPVRGDVQANGTTRHTRGINGSRPEGLVKEIASFTSAVVPTREEPTILKGFEEVLHDESGKQSGTLNSSIPQSETSSSSATSQCEPILGSPERDRPESQSPHDLAPDQRNAGQLVSPAPSGADPDAPVTILHTEQPSIPIQYSRPVLSLAREATLDVAANVELPAAVTADTVARPHVPGTGRRRFVEPAGHGPVRFDGEARFKYDARDGFWLDETEEERALRVRTSFDSYFDGRIAQGVEAAPGAFEQPFAGFGGSERMQDLQRLIDSLHDYDVPLFRTGGPATSFRESQSGRAYAAVTRAQIQPFRYLDDLSTFVPKALLGTSTVKRLRHLLDPDEVSLRPTDPPLTQPDAIARMRKEVRRCETPAQNAPTTGEPVYAAAARKIAKRDRKQLCRRADIRREDIDTDVSAGHCAVFSGPAGSGKSYDSVKMLYLLENGGTIRSTQTNTVLRWNTSKEAFKDKDWDRVTAFSYEQRAQLIEAAKDARDKGDVYLIIDEYSQLAPEDLAQLGIFQQIIAFGDYAQGNGPQPIFDFVRRCSGSSFIYPDVFRAQNSALFDYVSLLTYGGVYRALPHHDAIEAPNPFRVSFCIPDPGAEAVAMFTRACALRKEDPASTVLIVMDSAEGQAALERLNSGLNPAIPFASSWSAQGREADVLLLATADLDRSVPYDPEYIISRLSVLLGRAKRAVDVFFPFGPIAPRNRFTLLFEPIVFTTLDPIRFVPATSGLAGEVRSLGAELGSLNGYRMLRAARRYAYLHDKNDNRFHPELARHKGYDVLDVPKSNGGDKMNDAVREWIGKHSGG